jgi:hypothetical protein
MNIKKISVSELRKIFTDLELRCKEHIKDHKHCLGFTGRWLEDGPEAVAHIEGMEDTLKLIKVFRSETIKSLKIKKS